jgi:hypothetical protein
MKTRNHEQGTALIGTLLFLMAMGVLSTALVFTTQNEMKASTAFRYSQQALFAASAGVENSVQWFANTYSPYTISANYDGTTSPVRYSGNNVIMAGQTTNGSNFPSTAVKDSFLANVGNRNLQDAGGTVQGRYSVNATLLKYQPVSIIDPNTFATSPSAMERWEISSMGFWGPNAANPLGTAQITATIENSGNTIFDRALWGKRYVDLVGTSLIDSYDSRFPYNAVTNHGYLGAIGTNGDLRGTNNAEVRGDVAYGSSGAITIDPSQVTGSIIQLTQPRIFPPVPTFSVGSGSTTIQSNNPQTLSPSAYGNIRVQGDLTLQPGDYYIDSLTVTGQGRILLDGSTRLFVKSGFDVQGLGFVNATGNPCNLSIFYEQQGTSNADTAKLAGSATVAIQYYGPGAPLVLTGGSEYFGSFIADTVDANGGTAIHFSEGSLNQNIIPRPFRLVNWSQNSY